jgi:GAF domain-containing protein
MMVRDGDKAKSILEERGAPSLLITNLTLSRIDGFALLSELRKIATPAQTPAIAVSASMGIRTEAWHLKEKLGIAALIASGMSVDSIRGIIRRTLSLDPTPPPLAIAPAPAAPAASGTTEVRPAPRAGSAPHLDPSRLARINALSIVDDAPPDQDLQRLVQETAETFGVPIALVSIVLEDRQWFKAHIGLSGRLLADRGTPIRQSFCRHVVDADIPQPLVVPDAKAHPLFARNDLVLGGAVGSYAGAPLITLDCAVPHK